MYTGQAIVVIGDVFEYEAAERAIITLPVVRRCRVGCSVRAFQFAIQIFRKMTLISDQVQASVPLFPVML
jgi:hypothetical protein